MYNLQGVKPSTVSVGQNKTLSVILGFDFRRFDPRPTSHNVVPTNIILQ